MTVKTRAELKDENASDFPDNVARLISAADLRGQMDDTADSALFREDIDGLDVSQAVVTATANGTKTLAEWTADIDGGGGGTTAESEWINPRDYGLIADGSPHALSTRYASLAAAQAVYRFATSLTQQIDYCACKAASNAAFGADLELEIGSYTAVTAADPTGITIQDNTKAWTPLAGTGPSQFRGEHRHKEVYRKKASGVVDHLQILSNTADTLTVGTGGSSTDYGTPSTLPGGAVVIGDQYAIVYRPVTAGTDSTHITDSTQAWTVDEHAGKVAFRRFHSNATGDSAPVLSNTTTTLTLASPLPGGAVGATNLYTLGFGENGDQSQHLNRPLWLPPGRYMFGADTWLIRNLVGARIEGAGRRATTLTGNVSVMMLDGVWYTELSNFSIECLAANPLIPAPTPAPPAAPIFPEDETAWVAAFEIDGYTGSGASWHPYPTRGVQGVTLRNMLISAGGSPYAFTMLRRGTGNGQGSECLFSNVHLQYASYACYYQNGFNALANTFIGGNIQSYPKFGAFIFGGTFAFINTGFQSTYGYRQIENAGADIRCGDGGAYEACVISGCRSESLVFLHNAGAVTVNCSGVVGHPAITSWSASTSFGAAAASYKAIADATPGGQKGGRLFVATTEGITGTVEPVWESVATGGTVADGTVVWTETPFNTIYNYTGYVDPRTVLMGVGNYAIQGRDRIRRVTADATVVWYEDGILADATAGPITIIAPPLPGASGLQHGRSFFVKKVDNGANAVTIVLSTGFEDGQPNVVIPGGSRGGREFIFGPGSAGTLRWLEKTQDNPRQQTLTDITSFTLPVNAPYQTRLTGTLAADRRITLTTVSGYAGLSFKITHTGAAFNWIVSNPGPVDIKTLPVNSWGEFTHNGTSYYLSAYGSL